MRASNWFIATLKETPHDAELVSHQFMLRAGMIRKLGLGLYTWLPLGLRVLHKVEAIVREEMNQAGAMEVLMPAVHPAELWEETGRWETFGGQLLKMVDSNQREYCFGPTHEEVITDLMRHELHSYKQLPANFYQIQTKFRDEIRPRFGLMRAREFIMKDAYSFHADEESLQLTYDTMYRTYSRIFDRLGLHYRAVEADTGAIGGSSSHEFQVLAASGEDIIFYSDGSDYAANIEQATAFPPTKQTTPVTETLSLVDTPNKKTIEEVATFCNLEQQDMVKTLIVHGEEHPLIALVLRGDDSLNEVKASKHPWVKAPLCFASNETILDTLNVPVGFIGPVSLPIPVIVDHAALAMPSFACGANQKDKHYLHAVWDRDATHQDTYDLRNVKPGDKSPDGKGSLQQCRGIEVGHIFQLGCKYTTAMKAEFLDDTGKLRPIVMGTYGLGISRVVAAAIEQHHDDRGIIWPESMAPFRVVIIPINGHRCAEVLSAAETLYEQLLGAQIDVLLDDRAERPGVLFADHDLIGIPHRFILGERNLEQNQIEYKARNAGQSILIPMSELADFLNKTLGLQMK